MPGQWKSGWRSKAWPSRSWYDCISWWFQLPPLWYHIWWSKGHGFTKKLRLAKREGSASSRNESWKGIPRNARRYNQISSNIQISKAPTRSWRYVYVAASNLLISSLCSTSYVVFSLTNVVSFVSCFASQCWKLFVNCHVGYDSGEKKRIPAWCDRVLYRDSRSVSVAECSLECPVVASITSWDSITFPFPLSDDQ